MFKLPYTAPTVLTLDDTERAQLESWLAPLPGVMKSFCESHLKLAVTMEAQHREMVADQLHEFTALVPLGSGVDTTLGLSIARPLLLEMTRRFEPDFAAEEIEALAESVGAEIANTLVGNATVYFTHLAHRVAIGTPRIVRQDQRAAAIGPRAFRGFAGQGEAGAFIVFCMRTGEGLT